MNGKKYSRQKCQICVVVNLGKTLMFNSSATNEQPTHSEPFPLHRFTRCKTQVYKAHFRLKGQPLPTTSIYRRFQQLAKENAMFAIR